MKYQVHRCTGSCQRFVFSKKTKQKAIICRYGFPMPVQPYASLNTLIDSLKSVYSKHNKLVKIYSLARTYEERYINPYNPYLLLLWEIGNMDIQFIATKENALNRYITGYLTKAEKSNSEEIWNECNLSLIHI